MIKNKPEDELRGRCDMLFCMIQFKVTETEQEHNYLYYDHRNKRIDLKQCAHVKLLTENILSLIMINGGIITMRVPYIWLLLLPKWIAYLRQVPLWQVMPMKTLTPQSWAKKRVIGMDRDQWDLIYLRLTDCKTLHYFADEMRREEPLGSVDVAQDVTRVENTLRIGPWMLKFETVSLCRAWKRILVYTEEPEDLEVPKIGSISSKLENKRMIDAARRKHLRRKSIGDEWDESDEDEELLHMERVIRLLKNEK